jgi:rod shape determining protein RodA
VILSSRRPILAVVLAALGLAAAGILAICSAGLASPLTARSALWVRQIGWLALGAVAALLVARADLRKLAGRRAFLIHGALILATVATVAGRDFHGTHRWIHLGRLFVQPSELLKLGLVLSLASAFRRPASTEVRTLRDLAAPAAIVACSIIPVLTQPDLGTALVLGLIAATMLALEPVSGGAKVLGAAALASLPAYWMWGVRSYQRERLLAFLHGADPAGAGYHSLHALRVAGSGGLLGQGTGSFASAEPHPLPEAHSDFVLSVWAHEHGFAGVAVLLALYAALVVAILSLARDVRDRFGARVVVGVAALFFWQAAVNMGMALGLLPVIGVPLPLVSYGGSSAFTCLVGLGLVASVARRFHVTSAERAGATGHGAHTPAPRPRPATR